MSPEPKYLTQAELIVRGWTRRMIDEHLGEPDDLVPNPHHPRAAPMRLFAADRIVAAEQITEIAEERARLARRRAHRLSSPPTKRRSRPPRSQVGIYELSFVVDGDARGGR